MKSVECISLLFFKLVFHFYIVLVVTQLQCGSGRLREYDSAWEWAAANQQVVRDIVLYKRQEGWVLLDVWGKIRKQLFSRLNGAQTRASDRRYVMPDNELVNPYFSALSHRRCRYTVLPVLSRVLRKTAFVAPAWVLGCDISAQVTHPYHEIIRLEPKHFCLYVVEWKKIHRKTIVFIKIYW